MSEYMFVGGPLHGQLRDVEDGTNSVKVPSSSRDAQGNLILGETVYMRRGLNIRQNSTGQEYVRHLYVVADLPPQMASVMLGELFVMLWVLEGDPVTDVGELPQLTLTKEPEPLSAV